MAIDPGTQNKNSIWWGPPKKFSDRQHERKISWLELFYDLVYAAVISQLSHRFADHLSWYELAHSLFLFCLVFWSWMNGSLYHDLHGSEGIRTRLQTLLQMLAVASVAITLSDAFSVHYRNFAISFLVVQILITYQWWSTGYYDHSHKKLNVYYVTTYSAGIFLFAASIFTDYSISRVLWALTLLLNLGVGLITYVPFTSELKRRGEEITISASLIERFGLFTIMVLAESIFGIVNGISDIKVKSHIVWASFIISLLIAFLLWWIYFDMIGDQKVKKGYKYLIVFTLLHLPLLASFGIIGSLIKIILSEKNINEYNFVKWIFCAAIATILIVINLLTGIMEQDKETKSFSAPVSRLLLYTALTVLIIGAFGSYLYVIVFLSGIAFALLVPVYIGTRSWFHYKLFYEDKS